MYGRLAEAKAENDDFIRSTVTLLTRLRDGEVSHRQLVVSDSGWKLKGLESEPDGTDSSAE